MPPVQFQSSPERQSSKGCRQFNPGTNQVKVNVASNLAQVPELQVQSGISSYEVCNFTVNIGMFLIDVVIKHPVIQNVAIK